MFFARRFLWTQSAASSADLRSPNSATSRSRSAFDCAAARTIRGGPMAWPLRLAPEGAKGRWSAGGFAEV